MDRSSKLLPIFLAGLLMVANTACACASAMDSVSDNDPHAHHQVQDATPQTDGSGCPHQECDDCELTLAATPATEADLASFAKLGFDDDLVWTETTAVDRHPPGLFARTQPPLHRPSWAADSPIRRADLLLE
jgi:hypothetical protein